MVIVLPTCKKDVQSALRNLAWCLQLNPSRQPFACWVSHEAGFGEVGSVVEAARMCFSEVREIVYAPYRGNLKWPLPQNYAFKQALIHMAKHSKGAPWLWWEQDAVPLKPDWLTAIASAYQQCGKRFMGALGALSKPGSSRFLNGVAVYPGEACRISPKLIALGTTPFDVAGGTHVLTLSHISPLFQNVWSWNGPLGNPPTFQNAEDLGKLNPEAVIFHRCKDASLVEQLSLRLAQPSTPSAEKPRSSLIQTLMRWKYGTGRWLVGMKRKATGPALTQEPRLVHCMERHRQTNKDADRRVEQAQDSWVTLYKTGKVIPAHLWRYTRNSEQLGDARRLPFLKDVLIAGLNWGRRDDYLMLTNDDTILVPGVTDYLLEILRSKPAVSSFRINFDKDKIPSLSTNAADMVKRAASLMPRGDMDLGRDLFAFRKEWLRDNWHAIPDFLLGELEWDLILAYLIRRDAGVHTTKFNMDKLVPECEIPKGYVIHERHDRQWTSPQQEASAGKVWNRKLATQWYCDNDMHFLVTHKL